MGQARMLNATTMLRRSALLPLETDAAAASPVGKDWREEYIGLISVGLIVYYPGQWNL